MENVVSLFRSTFRALDVVVVVFEFLFAFSLRAVAVVYSFSCELVVTFDESVIFL